MKRIARVFPTKTKYTPDDDLVFFSGPTLLTPEVDEVHVSCLFTWDKPRAEVLARKWGKVCKSVKVGGPAYDTPGGEYTPGLYVRKGYTMTSRGCIRKCPFCLVPVREGKLRELTIHPGKWVIDNNLLACSRKHVEAVFQMLLKQGGGIKFLGGLDTHCLEDWHVEALSRMQKQIEFLYIAYDMPRDRDSVEDALRRFHEAGFEQGQLWCFALIGFGNEAPEEADKRCEWIFVHGGIPFATYYKDLHATKRKDPPEWAAVAKKWAGIRWVMSRMKRDGLQYHKDYVRGYFADKKPKPLVVYESEKQQPRKGFF